MKIAEQAIANVTQFRDNCKRAAEQMNWRIEDTSFAVWDFILSALEKQTDYDRLQNAFALACRLLDDFDCPCEMMGAKCEKECIGPEKTWKCWQKYFRKRVESEQVCRVCGCTQDNACPGVCYWVEPDLCSACAEEELDESEVEHDA